jgi:ATP-dependent protease HslVU (ClpYQ) ATPase subunit
MTMNHSATKQRYQKRAVCFAFISVIPIASPLDQLQNPDEWDAIWYTHTELENFRHEAHQICDQMKQQSQEGTSNNNTKDVKLSQQQVQAKHICHQPTMSMNSQSRGLEGRYCMERQRRKTAAIKYIVKTASGMLQYEDAEKLAEVAQRCNAWATSLAIEEATRDFVRAYSKFFVKRKWKKNFEDEVHTTRNIRSKTMY